MKALSLGPSSWSATERLGEIVSRNLQLAWIIHASFCRLNLWYCWSFSLLASVAGNGREVGIGDGFVRLRHWHSCCGRDASVVPMELADSVSSASPIVGNVFGMIPKASPPQR